MLLNVSLQFESTLRLHGQNLWVGLQAQCFHVGDDVTELDASLEEDLVVGFHFLDADELLLNVVGKFVIQGLRYRIDHLNFKVKLCLLIKFSPL